MSESNRSGEEFVLQTNESENLLKSIEDQKRDELLALYQQVEGTDDTAKKVLLYTEWSKMHLERYLDIKDLTNIEAVHLRNTVEQLLPKLEEERKLVAQEKMSAMNLAEIEEEAPALWLYNLYGIHPKDIPHIYVIEDETTGQKYTFEKTMEQQAREKNQELSDAGHSTYMFLTIPQDFKDYLKKLREESHRP